MVAPLLNLDHRARPPSAGRRRGVRLLNTEDVEEAHLAAVVDDQIDFGHGFELLGRAVRVTPRRDDLRAGVAPLGPPQHLARLAVGDVGDGAAIEDEDVGAVGGRHDVVAGAGEGQRQGFGLGLVELAAQVGDGGGRHGESSLR